MNRLPKFSSMTSDRWLAPIGATVFLVIFLGVNLSAKQPDIALASARGGDNHCGCIGVDNPDCSDDPNCNLARITCRVELEPGVGSCSDTINIGNGAFKFEACTSPECGGGGVYHQSCPGFKL